jgi:hypothetical protein
MLLERNSRGGMRRSQPPTQTGNPSTQIPKNKRGNGLGERDWDEIK